MIGQHFFAHYPDFATVRERQICLSENLQLRSLKVRRVSNLVQPAVNGMPLCEKRLPASKDLAHFQTLIET